jgi:hypothetical protein
MPPRAPWLDSGWNGNGVAVRPGLSRKDGLHRLGESDVCGVAVLDDHLIWLLTYGSGNRSRRGTGSVSGRPHLSRQPTTAGLVVSRWPRTDPAGLGIGRMW